MRQWKEREKLRCEGMERKRMDKIQLEEVERKRMDKIQLKEVESEIIRYRGGWGREGGGEGAKE